MRVLSIVGIRLLLMLLPLLGLLNEAQAKGDRYALLVGVREYDPNELRNLPYAEGDMEELAQVLRGHGYRDENLVVMTQSIGAKKARFLPESGRIRKELKGLLEDLTPADSVLIAFAGHGVQFSGDDDPYFCPMDAKLGDRKTLLALSEVYKQLEECGAMFKLLLVDACRNQPQSDNSRSRIEVKIDSLTRPPAKPPAGGLAALFSCSAGGKAFEHDRLQHGVFFHFIIEGLKGAADADNDKTVDLDELVGYARTRVRNFVRAEYGTDHKQMPHYVGNVRGTVALAKLASEPKEPVGVLLAWQLPQGAEFYQHMISASSQTINVAGEVMQQLQEQEMVYRWRVLSATDQRIIVEQTLIAVAQRNRMGEMVQFYDSTTGQTNSDAMARACQALVNGSFNVTIDRATMKAIQVTGHQAIQQRLQAADPNSALLAGAFLSESSLIAEANLALQIVPNQQCQAGASWTRETSRNLGPLGTFDQTVKYKLAGPEQPGATVQRIELSGAQTYRVPEVNQPGAPFRIKSGKVTASKSTGTVSFDPARGRPIQGSLSMANEARMAVEINGQESEILLKQEQTMTVKTLDRNPLVK